NIFTGCMFVNRREADVDGEAWAAILDGAGYKDVPTLFATPTTTRQSFTVNAFYKCTFQKPFGTPGPTIFMQDVSSLSFSSCYTTVGSGSIVEWRLTDFVPYRVYFDTQLETSGLARFINFTSDAAAAREVRGLRITFGNVMADQEIISH